MSKPNASPSPSTATPAPATTPAAHEEEVLDEALEETFPSSDPIAVSITREERPPKR
ncbi:hypothetical protein JOD97_001278 [Duganella sp. 1411]|uniref:hypothetical protein n=1 Tax=Duganella sp. 1411 TaxID=2806572 RepID=UPI001AE79E50|nr:hypothetical protein [Duganella sp. 1411]MBP1203264.1 hypothetical protein [Duganella sp. 1411]